MRSGIATARGGRGRTCSAESGRVVRRVQAHMNTRSALALSAALVALCGCAPHLAILTAPAPKVEIATPLPVALPYRESVGGLVLVSGRIDDKVDAWFILDTGAPVSVLIDGRRTRALGLDTSAARPLGDPNDPAAPVGIVKSDFRWDFGPVALSGLTAVVVPESSMPCRERFDAVDFAGVIGADLFRRFVVEIDPASRRIRLHDPSSWQVPSGAVTVPLSFRGGHPFIPSTVMLASGERIEHELHLDIGASQPLSLVATSHPALRMPEGEAKFSCLVNGTQEQRVGAPLEVVVGGVKMPVERPVYSDGRVKVQRLGAAGLALFGGRRVAIDYPGKRLVIL